MEGTEEGKGGSTDMQRASVMGMPSPEPSGSYSQQFKAMRFSYHIEGGATTSPQIRAGKRQRTGKGVSWGEGLCALGNIKKQLLLNAD